jgi:hypothetical protein
MDKNIIPTVVANESITPLIAEVFNDAGVHFLGQGIRPERLAEREMGNKSVRLSRKEEKRHAYHVEGNPRRPAQTPARCGRGRQARQDGVSVRSAGYPGKDGSAKGPSTREGDSRSKSGGQGQTGCSQREGQKEMSN